MRVFYVLLLINISIRVTLSKNCCKNCCCCCKNEDNIKGFGNSNCTNFNLNINKSNGSKPDKKYCGQLPKWKNQDEKYYKGLPKKSNGGSLGFKCWFDLDVMEKFIGPEKTQEYKDIVEGQSDDVKNIEELGLKDLEKEDILVYLDVKGALKQINNATTKDEKLKKILEIYYSDIENKRFPFSEASLKMPRCIIKQEMSNCVIQTFFGVSISNPYLLKLYYLIWLLFENNVLTEKDCPFTYDVCKIFADAIDKPNFNNSISVLKIKSDIFDDNLFINKTSSTKSIRSYFIEGIDIGSFICTRMRFEPDEGIYSLIILSIADELGDYEFDMRCFGRPYKTNFLFNYLSDSDGDDINYYLIPEFKYKGEDFNIFKDQYKDCDECIDVDCYVMLAIPFHLYYYRNIGGVWFSYDHYNSPKPKIVSNRTIAKMILNSISKNKNFNGEYSDKFITCTSVSY